VHVVAIGLTEEEGGMKLYTYYRSQESFRVRIALNLKGIAREDSFLHLEKGDQFAAEYRAINPQMVVPTLIDGDLKLFQSLAILEYLEETYPEPPLLPSDPVARAWVRGPVISSLLPNPPAPALFTRKVTSSAATRASRSDTSEGRSRSATRVATSTL
jgi:glutathione S-transferase